MKEIISNQIKEAMKAKDARLLEVLRSIMSKLTEAEKLNNNQALSMSNSLLVIEKLAKQREEALVLYRQAERSDLVDKEEYQWQVLKSYLPSKMNESETMEVLKKAIEGGANDIGSLMKAIAHYGTKIDKKLVSVLAKDLF